MSAQCRAAAHTLRIKYAKTFKIDVYDIVIKELEGDVAEVYSPKHPNLPKWTTA